MLWEDRGGALSPERNQRGEDEVSVEDMQSELSKERRKDNPGKANTVKLGGKKCACPMDLLALGIVRAYTVTWGGTMNGVLDGQEPGEERS